ncbi:hypothetical protein DPMN_136536 [Dreissena polymorpha]|uniref:Uncharacterized protein n=1 Tax=Dreissena polymorpha TaxID=45954 RepID=A0A9D4G403_DREPO|nr:hypothetical protein DPMN_136536 [Dreissena polymorpha]
MIPVPSYYSQNVYVSANTGMTSVSARYDRVPNVTRLVSVGRIGTTSATRRPVTPAHLHSTPPVNIPPAAWTWGPGSPYCCLYL